MKKKIIITGISGQDASFLIEKLNKKYDIIGLSRSKTKKNIYKSIQTNYSLKELKNIIKKYKPKIIFNFAGQSNPNKSWDIPFKTTFSIVDITLNFLEVIIKTDKKIKFFNSSTSEIFSKKRQIINENSKIEPDNPYACAKAFAHNIVKAYRNKYKIFAINGILFNHESSRRSTKYLLKKLVVESINIKNKKQKKIFLNSKYHVRDISYAKDIVDGIVKIMHSNKNEDFILASGKSRSITEICNTVAKITKIDKKKILFSNNKNKKISYKIADISKIKKKLNWKPKYSFEQLITKMIKDEKI